MNKIEPKQTTHRRVPLRLFVTAAVVAALSVTALACALGAGTLFQDVFSGVTDGQVAVMDQIGKTFEGGVTSQGTTMTPVAALADENVYYLRLRIEGPAGTVLPDYGEDEGYYQLFGPDAGTRMTLDIPPDADCGYSAEFLWLPDGDPADNVKEVVVRLEDQPGTDLRFNDNVSKTLTIRGLWVQAPDKTYTQVLEGTFAFDIGLHYESQVVSLAARGLTWTDEAAGCTSTLEALTLSPLSLSYRYTATEPGDPLALAGVGPLEVVLKDGSTVPMTGAPSSDTEGYLVFDYPLDLTQVDCVRYGGHRVPVEVR